MIQRGYAICTVARSGSTWLAEVLGRTGVLGRPAEYFSTDFQRGTADPDYPADRAAQVRLVLTAGATPNGVYGFKMFPMNLDDVSRHISWTEAFPDLRFVHLSRRDVLGQALSRVRAFQTRRWRSTLPEQAVPVYDGAAILDALRLTVRQDARWTVYFARNGIAPLRLVYEDALDAVAATVASVADLVGLEAPPASVADIGLAVQRDALTEVWRARFLSEYRDRDALDAL